MDILYSSLDISIYPAMHHAMQWLQSQYNTVHLLYIILVQTAIVTLSTHPNYLSPWSAKSQHHSAFSIVILPY